MDFELTEELESVVPELVEGKGGNAAKQARIAIEKQTGESIVTSNNAKALGNQADD